MGSCRGESASSEKVARSVVEYVYSLASPTFAPQTPYKDLNIQSIQTIPYPYPLSTVFPPTRSSSTTPNGNLTGSTTPTPAGPNGAKILVATDLERGRVGWEDALGFLKVVEYRYTRFALDERSGEWKMIR